MAKKKEERLSYLQMPLPKGQKKTRTVKVNWSGLNYRQTLDTGSLSKEKNISVSEAPYLTPFGTFEEFLDFGERYEPQTHSEESSEKGWNNAEFLYGLNDMLVMTGEYYKPGERNTYYQSLCFLEGNGKPIALASNDLFDNTCFTRLDDGSYYSSFEAIELLQKEAAKAISFNTFIDDNIANSDTSANTGKNVIEVENVSSYSVKKSVLLFPINKAYTFPVVETIRYRAAKKVFPETKLHYTNPWAFTEDFVDTSVVYNVVENGAIPSLGDLGWYISHYIFGTYFAGNESYALTEDAESNKALMLGYWYHNGSYWVPLGYTPATDTENAKRDYSLPNVLASFSTEANPCPKLKDVTVFQSRLFGVDDGKVYASEFNNYCGWSLDTAELSSSSNAWITAMNADVNASGILTAITAYQDRVVVFRENAMYEIRNTKNPFRVVSIFQEGCIGREALCIVNGMLFFVSRHGIMIYTGARPKDIGYELGFNRVDYAVVGGYNNILYVYCETDIKTNNLFAYNTTTGAWSEIEIKNRVKCFANNNNGFYMLCDDNKVCKLNEDAYSGDWMVETDFYTGRTIDIKHLQKIQMFAEMGPKSHFEVYILYDNEEYDDLPLDERKNRRVCLESNVSENKRNALVRVIPRKNANYGFKIRIQGSGYVKLYQMELTMTGGGELFNE